MNSTHFTAATAVALALALVLVIAGCGKSASQSAAEMAVVAATGGKVQVSQSGDQSQVTVKTDQGMMTSNTGDNLAMPRNFPSDVHLPTSAYTVNNVMQLGPSTVVTMHSGAAVGVLYSEYDSAMKAAGWKETVGVQSAQSDSMLSFQKDDRIVTVSMSAESDKAGTVISLQHVVEQKTGG